MVARTAQCPASTCMQVGMQAYIDAACLAEAMGLLGRYTLEVAASDLPSVWDCDKPATGLGPCVCS